MPASPLEEKETKLLPMIASKASLLLTEKLLKTVLPQNNFLVQD